MYYFAKNKRKHYASSNLRLIT